MYGRLRKISRCGPISMFRLDAPALSNRSCQCVKVLVVGLLAPTHADCVAGIFATALHCVVAAPALVCVMLYV